jgi:hypothetical protein
MDRLRGLGCAWDLPGIGGASRCGQLGHDFDLHVAVLQLPFVVLLEQHRADQPDNRGFIGENANNVARRLTSLLSRSSGFVTGMKIAVPARSAGIGLVPAYGATIRDEGRREHAEWAGRCTS